MSVVAGFVVNEDRRKQLTSLMVERGWASILLYGHGWRKEHFRSLVNFNYAGPHAAVWLSRAGDVKVTVSARWDAELLPGAKLARDFAEGLRSASAVAGLEIMERRLVAAVSQGGAAPASATAEVEEFRRVKTPRELEAIEKAVDLADRGYQHFVETARVGMREYELVAEVEGFLKEHGAEDNFMLIASGGTEVMGMRPPTDRKLAVGDSITTELTPQVDGYYAQICRTLVMGEPSEAQQAAFAIFAEAQQAAEDLAAPGVNVSEVARVQNDVFRRHGYGEFTGSRYTRVRGHGLGLFPDEAPHILEDVDYLLKPGMVVIAHPNTYLPLSGYMVFGDTLLITEAGNRRLNRTAKRLFAV